MKKFKVIYNPVSGKDSAGSKAFQTAKHILSNHDVEITFFATKKKGDATENAIKSCNEDYDLIIACGGDGTVHEVVNGMMQCENRTPLAILPAGTVNDLAQQLNMPSSPEKFAKLFDNMNFADLDVGKINDNYFVNVACGGGFTHIPHLVSSELKTALGRYAYYFQAIFEIPEQLSKSYNFKYIIDGECFELESYLFLISNTPGAGGFKLISPNAKIDDGLLDIVIFEKTSYADLLQIFTSLFSGHHVRHSKVKYFQAENISVELENDTFSIDVDGEHGGNGSIQVSSCKRAIKVLVP